MWSYQLDRSSSCISTSHLRLCSATSFSLWFIGPQEELEHKAFHGSIPSSIGPNLVQRSSSSSSFFFFWFPCRPFYGVFTLSVTPSITNYATHNSVWQSSYYSNCTPINRFFNSDFVILDNSFLVQTATLPSSKHNELILIFLFVLVKLTHNNVLIVNNLNLLLEIASIVVI